MMDCFTCRPNFGFRKSDFHFWRFACRPIHSAQTAQLEANTFDMLCHLAFDALVLTRCQRADRVNRQKTTFNKFFAKETGEIMNNLQEKHTSDGELQLTLP